MHNQATNSGGPPVKAAILPKLEGELSMSPEIEALINDPVYPTEEQLKDPRIQSLLDDEIH